MQHPSSPQPPRRRFSPEFKRHIVSACQQPGARTAAIAHEHDIGVNVVRRWIRQAALARDAVALTPASSSAFVALPLQSVPPAAAEPIRLELRRGTSSISLQWPASAGAQCGAWLREWLR